MRTFRILYAISLLVWGIVATPPPAWAQDHSETRAITGAGAHFAWIVFEALRPDMERVTGRKFKLHGLNSSLGLGCNAGIKVALQNEPGQETFGFVCCPLDKAEIEQKALVVHPIALEPIMIVVNEDNPVRNLSLEQVRAIFRGEITNWKEVGGKNQAIVVVTRLHCKKRPGHWKLILPNPEAFRPERLHASSAAEMEHRVSSFPGAIGHIGSTWDFDHQSRVRAISIDGAAPTAENLRNHRYPFYRQLSAVTSRSASPDVIRAIEEVQKGPALRKIAEKYELVPLVQ
ncbi:MAG TPA: hypothetical protein ENJ05_00665 [Thiotrichales bacterium]|nr:hypothetical protein [Thiotrichales bacterium]